MQRVPVADHDPMVCVSIGPGLHIFAVTFASGRRAIRTYQPRVPAISGIAMPRDPFANIKLPLSRYLMMTLESVANHGLCEPLTAKPLPAKLEITAEPRS